VFLYIIFFMIFTIGFVSDVTIISILYHIERLRYEILSDKLESKTHAYNNCKDDLQ